MPNTQAEAYGNMSSELVARTQWTVLPKIVCVLAHMKSRRAVTIEPLRMLPSEPRLHLIVRISARRAPGVCMYGVATK
eukprot:6209228-Pleurochrysis_carterae.AAC.3